VRWEIEVKKEVARVMSTIYPIYSGNWRGTAIDSTYITSPLEDAFEKEVKEGG